MLTASADHTARLWDVATGMPIGLPLPHQGVVWFAAFSPDGQIVLSTSLSGEARLWDAGREACCMNSRACGARYSQGVFSRDSKTLVTAGDDRQASRLERGRRPAAP